VNTTGIIYCTTRIQLSSLTPESCKNDRVSGKRSIASGGSCRKARRASLGEAAAAHAASRQSHHANPHMLFLVRDYPDEGVSIAADSVMGKSNMSGEQIREIEKKKFRQALSFSADGPV